MYLRTYQQVNLEDSILESIDSGDAVWPETERTGMEKRGLRAELHEEELDALDLAPAQPDDLHADLRELTHVLNSSEGLLII